MNKEKFLDIMNSCILIKSPHYPDSIFFYYDVNLFREIKLNRILNTNTKIDLSNYNREKLLFEIEYNWEFWILNEDLFEEIKNNIHTNHIIAHDLLIKWLKNFNSKFIITNITKSSYSYLRNVNDLKWKII